MHTPYFIDLISSGSMVLPDLAVPVPERFIKPQERQHLYVPGSPEAYIGVVGKFAMIVWPLVAFLTISQYHDFCNICVITQPVLILETEVFPLSQCTFFVLSHTSNPRSHLSPSSTPSYNLCPHPSPSCTVLVVGGGVSTPPALLQTSSAR